GPARRVGGAGRCRRRRRLSIFDRYACRRRSARMSQAASITPSPVAVAPPAPGWPLWRRQVGAIIRLELRKGFAGRRAIGLYLLAMAPAALFVMRLLVPRAIVDPGDVGDATVLLAQVYQDFILPVVVFLACVLVFGNLIRREVLDRSLHFYFLSPLRRE